MLSLERERQVIKKVTWRLVPLLLLGYMAAFINRVNVGFVKEPMGRDLGLTSLDYGFAAGVFFLGYFLFEVPSNLSMLRVGARRWLAGIMLVWGIVSAATMFARDATSLHVLRFLLGVAESGFFPGTILYLTTWYPAAYRTRAIALFMTAAVFSNVLGSPVSGLLLELDGRLGLRGWQWLFLVEGLPPILLAAAALRALPNGPREVRWLTAEERSWLEKRLQAEAVETDASKPGLRALFDSRVIVLSLVYASNLIGGYGLDFFMPTLIHEALPDASPTRVGLLNALPSLLAVFVMLLHSRSSDRRQERRWHFASASLCAGTGLFLASLPISPSLALGALVLAVSGRWSSSAPFWGISTALLSGRAAAAAIALINSVGNLGGFIGPYTMGWFKHHTGDYTTGLRVLAVVVVVGALGSLSVKTRARAG